MESYRSLRRARPFGALSALCMVVLLSNVSGCGEAGASSGSQLEGRFEASYMSRNGKEVSFAPTFGIARRLNAPDDKDGVLIIQLSTRPIDCRRGVEELGTNEIAALSAVIHGRSKGAGSQERVWVDIVQTGTALEAIGSPEASVGIFDVDADTLHFEIDYEVRELTSKSLAGSLSGRGRVAVCP